MNFKTSVRTCLKEKYSTFQGRASRSEFWFFTLFIILFNIALEIILSLAPDNLLLIIIYALASLAVILPNFAVTARRLHDTRRTGWWQIAPIVSGTPFYFAVANSQTLEALIFSFFLGIVALIFSIVLLVFLIQKGTECNNRFGLPPFIEDWKKYKEEDIS